MSESPEAAELLERIRRDEPGAFERFVDAYGDRIRAFGLRVCGHRADAEDVAQDTLLQAYRKLRTLDEPRALRSWLYRVASNACLMSRRRRPAADRERSLDELMPTGEGDLPDFRPRPDEAASRDELRAAVQRAVLDLPESYRLVVVLRDMEQLSTRETAEALGLPGSTVKMRLHRGRLMVREALERSLRTAGGAP